MLKNYFKIAWRNLMRNKSYAAINVSGLAVGIAVCLVIFIIIQYQTSFDRFHSKKDRTYRVLTENQPTKGADVTYSKSVPYPLPAALKNRFPEIETVAPVFASHNDELIVAGDNNSTIKRFREERGLFFTTPAFFNIFNFPLLAGSYASLKDPNTVLLTKEIAEKYFGDWKQALGNTIKLQSGGFMFDHSTEVLKITGILATIPANTDFQIKLVVSIETSYLGHLMANSTSWEETTPDFSCYVLKLSNTSAEHLNQQMAVYAKTVQSPESKDSYIFQPLSNIHYDAQAGNFSNKIISHQLLNVLWLIAAFILAIACVNFINLSTAQAVNRSKEVGVRKVLGSNQFQIQLQFIVETFLIVIGAVVLAIVFSLVAWHYVNRLLELSVPFSVFGSSTIILFLSVITVAVTVLAGFYPSIFLSRFNAVTALRLKIADGNSKGISLRRGLVIFQFIIAQGLIIGTIIIARQMDYFMDQPLGFDKSAIVNVPFRVDSVRMSKMNQLLSISGVQAVSFSSNTPVEDADNSWNTLKFDHASKDANFKAILKFADDQYVPAYKLPLIAGRNLKASEMTREFLVNESLMKSLGINNPDEILNKDISIWGDVITCPVVGVLKDFNNRSFRDKPAPLLITTNKTMYNQASIKLATTNITSTMKAVKNLWEQTFPDFVFEYKFLDEKIDRFYKQENQMSQLYKIFAAIAIFLSCLGLYGLASFMAVQRVKEVGIRKVLGASAAHIVYLFSREFILLIAIAFAIATPIAWYYMHTWLQGYAYRISISWWIFVAGGLAAVFIALATISFQAIKAARANPVKSLRSE